MQRCNRSRDGKFTKCQPKQKRAYPAARQSRPRLPGAPRSIAVGMPPEPRTVNPKVIGRGHRQVQVRGPKERPEECQVANVAPASWGDPLC